MFGSGSGFTGAASDLLWFQLQISTSCFKGKSDISMDRNHNKAFIVKYWQEASLMSQCL